MLFEARPQAQPGTMEQDPEIGRSDSQFLTYVLCRDIVDLTHEESRRLAPWQGVAAFGKHDPELGLLAEFCRIRIPASWWTDKMPVLSEHPIDHYIGRIQITCERPLQATFAQMIAELVPKDADQPRALARFSTEARASAEGGEKSLLDEILGRGLVTDPAEGVAEQRITMVGQQTIRGWCRRR